MKKVYIVLIYIVSIILSLSFGSVATVFTLNHFGLINNTVDSQTTDNKTVVVSKQGKTDVTIVEESTIKSAIDKVYDSVFVVETYDKSGKKISSGSGFSYKITKDKTFIITNYHVIENGSYAKIISSSGEEIDASIVGGDIYSDIAVLSTSSSKVSTVASIGSSSDMELGDTVFTVGSPLGSKYIGTVTKGILSGTNREVTVKLTNGYFIMNVLQTDAAINPGNSGGPLLNINGEVIGVTSMKLVQDQIEGMGFAIPIEIVMSTAEKLESGNNIERPYLGVSVIDVSTAYILRRYGLNTYDLTSGVIIYNVSENTPASSVLQVGDIITAIDDNKIDDSAHFNYALYKYNVGDSIKITYYREGKKQEANIVLSKKL